jgi:hypothetical protein
MANRNPHLALLHVLGDVPLPESTPESPPFLLIDDVHQNHHLLMAKD